MKPMYNWRHQYDEDRDVLEGAAAAIDFPGETLTIEGAPDTDINEMMARFGINDYSQLPADSGVFDPSYYGDFTDIPDLREALERVTALNDTFMALPAKVRARFSNNPVELYNFIHEPDNRLEAEALGLLAPRPPQEAPAVPPTPPTNT